MAEDPGARVVALASPKGLRSGTILKIKFGNVVGEFVVILNCEFAGVHGCAFLHQGQARCLHSPLHPGSVSL